jgi:hypothetical protein
MTEAIYTKANMFEPVLLADPSFEQRWAIFQADWSDDLDPPLYLALQSLAEHILDRLGRRDTSGLAKVFQVVDRWITNGDAYVSEAAVIGLLESLQNNLGGNDRNYRRADGVTSADVEAYFASATRRWWEKLHRFWEGDVKALHDDS